MAAGLFRRGRARDRYGAEPDRDSAALLVEGALPAAALRRGPTDSAAPHAIPAGAGAHPNPKLFQLII